MSISELSVLPLLLLLAAGLCSISDATIEEGAALRALLQSWENANFTTWTDGRDPCEKPIWESVTCDQQGRVTGLNISNHGVSGTLSEAILLLPNLQVLDISNSGDSVYKHLPQNAFKGPLPASLFRLTYLRSLNLSTMKWGISFPAAVSQLQNLEEFEISGAELTGPIPPEFFRLPKLRTLYLSENTDLILNLTDFSQLGLLEELSLFNTGLNATIPADLGDNWPRLWFLNLHDCSLHGALPDNFGSLKSLRILQLYNNQLTGHIPDTWKALQNLTTLRIHDNYLSGLFPTWLLTEMPNLRQLYLDDNFFWGEAPQQSLLANLALVRFDCNYMNGTDPQANKYSSESPYRTRYNCYFTSVTPSDLRKVTTECSTHGASTPSLSCDEFYKQIVNSRPSRCAPCPPNQYIESNNAVTNPCVCGYTGGPKRSDGGGVPVGAVVGGVLGLFVVFCLVLGFILWKRRKQFAWLDVFRSTRKDLGEWDPPQGVQRFSLAELARITDNFNDSKVLGAGGFGKVFFGTLEDGRMVAIKRASPNSVQGLGEFRNEVVLLSRLHHRHLVRLEGFCEEEGLEILVYEYMINGNLHAHLLGKVTSTPLHWYKRIEIAVAVAQGLEYLHYYADPPVIHRDVKPSNILLDENMIAKLADFGISKATAEFDTHVSTRPAGTAGYLDPEYFLRRQLTTSSDVYAYGVVLLELVTGQEAIDHKRVEEFNLIEWVKKRFRTSGIVAIIDPLIDYEYPKDAYGVMTDLALRCASFNKDERPNMKVVLATLEPYLVQYAHHQVPLKPKHRSQKSKADDHSSVSTASGSDTQGSIPTDPSYEAASVALLSRSVAPR